MGERAKDHADLYPEENNKILTQNVSIGYNAKLHRRNLNPLVVGGSGAGKTRFFSKPNVMQGNTSFVILDPKGEILRDTGNLLKKKGYEVRVLDLFIRGERSILDYKHDILSHPNVDLSADGDGERYDHGKIESIGLGVEIVDPADYPDLNLDEIPFIDEYYAGFYAYDEDETEELANFLKNVLESEKT